MNNILRISLILVPIFFAHKALSQTLSLEKIFDSPAYRPQRIKAFEWLKDSSKYSQLIDGKNGEQLITQKSWTDDSNIDTVLRSYSFVDEVDTLRISGYEYLNDEKYVLISTKTESIYRRSSKSDYYIFHRETEKLLDLAGNQKISNVSMSPTGEYVSYTFEGNLYLFNLSTKKTTTITHDGEKNKIINGSTDWVYEEELEYTKAYNWGPHGKKIAYLKFDETKVKEYTMQIWGNNLYPKSHTFKYPKAGEDNAVVSLWFYDIERGKNEAAPITTENDGYIASLQWTTHPNTVSIVGLNRPQNERYIIHYNLEQQKADTVFKETSDTYIDINFLRKPIYMESSFFITSEANGFKHIYEYSLTGNLLRQVTTGNWEVSELHGYHTASKTLFYTSTEVSPLEKHLFSISETGKNKKRITRERGCHYVNFNKDLSLYTDYFTSLDEPLKIALYDFKGNLIQEMVNNTSLKHRLNASNLSKKELIKIPLNSGDTLDAYIMKPLVRKRKQKHPLLMYLYGGPGSQSVTHSWGGNRQLWFHYLNQLGYIVVCVDNRGTGGKGEAFKKITYGRLGKIEVQDQLEAARYLSKLDFIDPNRIGIWGWSYGGYMSSLCLFIGNNIFKAGIAVAPVTHWKFYDTIYTERFLNKPSKNKKGYEAYSPINHVGSLKGNYLLIHGTSDDNVHIQNSISLQNALIRSGKAI